MYITIFYVIIIFLLFDYLFERFLEYLNSTTRSNPIPDELHGIYDDTKYNKQQNYEKATSRFEIITSTFNLLIILTMLFYNGFAFIDNYIQQNISNDPILSALLFFGILIFASELLNTPFSIYSTFVIEEKFGFNKTTVKTFILDKIKSWLIGGILMVGVVSVVIWLILHSGENFWFWAWLVVATFILLMAMFYSNLIVPLFNKQQPLEDGDLKNQIEAFCHKVNFKLSKIFILDGSKRSTKANAYFTGFGAKRRIVLYDTLKNDLTNEEIVAVLAHEVGHYKRKHTIMMLLVSLIQTGIILFILGKFVNEPALTEALGADNHSIHLALFTFGLLFSPISFIIEIFVNLFSRRNEFQADDYARDNYSGEHLVSALKKLSEKNLSNLTPHPAYVFFHYSHPPLLERVRNLWKNKKQ